MSDKAFSILSILGTSVNTLLRELKINPQIWENICKLCLKEDLYPGYIDIDIDKL